MTFKIMGSIQKVPKIKKDLNRKLKKLKHKRFKFNQ